MLSLQEKLLFGNINKGLEERKRAAGILKKMGYTSKSIGGISGYRGTVTKNGRNPTDMEFLPMEHMNFSKSEQVDYLLIFAQRWSIVSLN